MEQFHQIQSSIEQEIPREEKIFWPEKEKFFQEREAFIQKNLDATKELLRQNGVEDKAIDEIANIALRAEFVQVYMEKHSPVESHIPVNVNFDPALPENKGGFTSPYFSRNGKEGCDNVELKEILDNDKLSELQIDKIDINLNLGHVIKNAEFYKFLRICNAATDEQTQKNFDELAIRFEIAAIEEVAHSFYFKSASKDPIKFKKAIEMMIGYNHTQAGIDPSVYEDTDIETRATIWQRAYLRKYYPESKALEFEIKQREEQKERMEKRKE